MSSVQLKQDLGKDSFWTPHFATSPSREIKAAKSITGRGNANEDVLQENFLRVLMVAGHLKEAAKFTNIKVVPIVGGMSTEKQERLLKHRPEIVVGTPGRLWELMSRGDEHLVEVIFNLEFGFTIFYRDTFYFRS
ncbi:Dead-box atp-dependent rna helicase [Thalictrum thalictroides]|uniref:Dead-box atp-dependent rna helicase n=1 Tax=Thalictrum thalictroides TaxID=46969 RepID=A0A7J6VGD8_THATH|nr:Dead-box atp-dependent rna helicase [Thalictrum thalictroides]